MTVLYFDSSAFVKLVVEEPGSELAAELRDGYDAAVSSRLAYLEVRAALSAGPAGRLATAEVRRSEAACEDCWSATRALQLIAFVAADAGRPAGLHQLPGADAMHLWSLLVVGGTSMHYAFWDQRLRSAAAAVGALGHAAGVGQAGGRSQ